MLHAARSAACAQLKHGHRWVLPPHLYKQATGVHQVAVTATCHTGLSVPFYRATTLPHPLEQGATKFSVMQMHVHQVQINVSESSKVQLATGLHESQAHTFAAEGTLLLTSSTSSYALVSFEIGAHMWCSGFWHATGTFATELLPLPAVALHPAHHLQQSSASVAGWQYNVVLVRLGQVQEPLLPGLINIALRR